MPSRVSSTTPPKSVKTAGPSDGRAPVTKELGGKPEPKAQERRSARDTFERSPLKQP